MRLRRQDGQIIPVLLVVMLSLLAVGLLFFQVGRAAIFSTEAQTAADAAALAAVKNVRTQLMAQVATTGTSDMALINGAAVRAAAESYARRNGARVTRLDRRGVDVKVWVSRLEGLGGDGRRAEARARARIDLVAIPGAGGSSIGPLVTGGDPTIDDDEWEELGKQISSPPTCGTSASSNDLVKLTALLRSHGFHVAENADIGSPPGPKAHSQTGYHYRCRNSAALDVNWPNPNTETGVIDGIVRQVQELGFRTIWRAAGHFDHIHIDVGSSGAIGAGGDSGGAVGGLEETALEVRLIDWDTAYTAFFGFGGFGSGGFYGGPPDPEVARAICRVLDRYAAPPKVRLSAFEAAIVESGVHNLSYGDRDSLGVFQQRPSQGWGTPAQILNPEYAATQFITRAIRANGSQSAGQLAQDVQRSAFPDRYDQVALQALALLEKHCG